MADKQKILIITDNAASTKDIASELIACFGDSRFSGYTVSAVEAINFSGTDLLPVYAFFIGCESPEAFSESYIEDFFYHINLAGRPCGIFSPNKKTIKYLSELLNACEASLCAPYTQKNISGYEKKLVKWMNSICCNG